MTTADWALIISIISALISLAGFIWNVWSKFIYPKPRVRVGFAMMTAMQPGVVDEDPVQALCLSATNMGPAEVTLTSALTVTRDHWFTDKSHGMLNVLPSFPESTDYTDEYYRLGGGLFACFPKKLAIGETFSAYLVPDHESLARGDYDHIGFNDTFGQMHWAPRADILRALPYIREACEKSGKHWRKR